MTKLGPHNRLIVREADAALKPLGLQQKGRSRSWIGDYGFWVIIVEFQFHKWDPGTFINVGGVLAVPSEGARSTVART
jgi:hypothetical protein